MFHAPSSAFSRSPDAPHREEDAARILDLLALWEGDSAALRRAVEDQTDWGPFELAEMTPAFYDVYGARRILCRFVFHGEAGAREPFERDLRRRLASITSWKDAPRARSTDSTHSEIAS
ncbi:hypothetical protein [Hyphococcus sp.]|jgi:hypothetical protein|uniref:hypothetical protein n=1 Tax=Hyphococcus sp. TaxID=2038636 RepID=UPI003D10C56F